MIRIATVETDSHVNILAQRNSEQSLYAKGRKDVCPPLLRRLTEDLQAILNTPPHLQILRQPPGPVWVSLSLQQTPALTAS